jgi:hypothetical protein
MIGNALCAMLASVNPLPKLLPHAFHVCGVHSSPSKAVSGFASELTLLFSSVQLVVPIFELLQVVCIPLPLLVNVVSALDDCVPPDLSLFALTNGSLDGFVLATATFVLLSAAPILMGSNIGITPCISPVLDSGRVSLHGSQTAADLTSLPLSGMSFARIQAGITV